jgi:hypothetical protein
VTSDNNVDEAASDKVYQLRDLQGGANQKFET